MGCGAPKVRPSQDTQGDHLNNKIPNFLLQIPSKGLGTHPSIIEAASETRSRQRSKQLESSRKNNINNEEQGKQRKKKQKVDLENFFDFIDQKPPSESFAIIDKPLDSKQQAFILKSLKENQIFFNLSSTVHERIVTNMIFCGQKKGEMVFVQGGEAQHSFIIWQGKVSVLVNDKPIKELSVGETFGDLALQFNCPRSASIKTLTDCQFFALDRKTFRTILKELQESEYQENLAFIQKVPFFNSMTQEQKHSVAGHLVSNKYTKGQMIVREGDEAVSYYVIRKGQVRVLKGDKEVNKMGELDQFGEQALYEKSLRGASVIAITEVICLTLSRVDLMKVLGKQVQEAVLENIMRWSFHRSEILKAFTSVQIEKILHQIQLEGHKKGDKLILKGDEPDLIIILNGSAVGEKAFEKGSVINDQYLTKKYRGKSISQPIEMKEDGIIARISISQIETITGGGYEDVVERNKNSHEKIIKEGGAKVMHDNCSLQELVNVKFIGQGGFSKVYLVANPKSNSLHALKVLEKADVVKMSLERNMINVIGIMKALHFPFILTLHQTYKDKDRIYFLQEFIEGQVLFDFLKRLGILTNEFTQFYVAQILLALEYMHTMGIIYRDLKPENLMVGKDGYIKLIDMDTAKRLKDANGSIGRTYTVIGTPHYMAPEIMNGKGYGLYVDLFSLGVVAYELLTGAMPYGEDTDDPYEIYQEILQTESLRFPHHINNSRTKKFVSQLLDKQPSIRLGGSYAALKANKWFDRYDWDMIFQKKITPDHIPKKTVEDKEITQNLKKGQPVIQVINMNHQQKTCGKSSVPNWDSIF